MSKNINFDFELSRHVAKELDDISNEIRVNVFKNIMNRTDDISRFWQSDASKILFDEIRQMGAEINVISAQIQHQADEIRAVSKKIFITEQEAKHLAESKSNEADIWN